MRRDVGGARDDVAKERGTRGFASRFGPSPTQGSAPLFPLVTAPDEWPTVIQCAQTTLFDLRGVTSTKRCAEGPPIASSEFDVPVSDAAEHPPNS